ncbi:hypothetical protein AOQ84DRAFT_23340 [Glonium stellatum]|uniref:Uncharacterized protein n=1 Tax=Glonium stellatum TaxID=574774 RepID=A0A8E2F2I3_9PEZI|nr:hypothetical protein AOQ84DRAFT_23340 [Glonium stellatum]
MAGGISRLMACLRHCCPETASTISHITYHHQLASVALLNPFFEDEVDIDIDLQGTALACAGSRYLEQTCRRHTVDPSECSASLWADSWPVARCSRACSHVPCVSLDSFVKHVHWCPKLRWQAAALRTVGLRRRTRRGTPRQTKGSMRMRAGKRQAMDGQWAGNGQGKGHDGCRQALQTSRCGWGSLASRWSPEPSSNRVTGGFYRAEPHSGLPHCPPLACTIRSRAAGIETRGSE